MSEPPRNKHPKEHRQVTDEIVAVTQQLKTGQVQSHVSDVMLAGARQIKRGLVFIVGATVVLMGIIMIFTPGPAVVVIPAGLGILAIEFAWAQRLLKKFKDKAQGIGADLGERLRNKN